MQIDEDKTEELEGRVERKMQQIVVEHFVHPQPMSG
jgi:hypothetical protein